MDSKLILNHILTFISALCGNPGLPRKIVHVTVEYMDNFIRTVYVPYLRSEFISILTEKSVEHDTLRKVCESFDKYGSIFGDILTAPKRFSLLRPKGFINYEKFQIITTFIHKIFNNDMLLVPDFLYAIHVCTSKRKITIIFMNVRHVEGN